MSKSPKRRYVAHGNYIENTRKRSIGIYSSSAYSWQMPGVYNRKDQLYKRAKSEGLLSRAAYKLDELDKKFKLFSPGLTILDLGAAPGSWSQVALRKVGKGGMVIGIDLESVEMPEKSIPQGSNWNFIQGDILDESKLEELESFSKQGVDGVISDLSPKLSGIKFADAARSSELVEMAFSVAERWLKPGGFFVAKIFPGPEADNLLKTKRSDYQKLSRIVLDSTRKSSKEFYLVGKNFRKKN